MDAEIESFDFCDGFEGLNVLVLSALKVSIGPFEKSGGDAFNYFIARKLVVDFLRLSFALFLRFKKNFHSKMDQFFLFETFLEKKKLSKTAFIDPNVLHILREAVAHVSFAARFSKSCCQVEIIEVAFEIAVLSRFMFRFAAEG